MTTAPVIAFIGLGSNLGDRAANIRGALDALARAGLGRVEILRVAPPYENPAVGGPSNSPDFLNTVAEIRTALGPHEMMALLLEIERQFGRERGAKDAPRTLDLDILLYGGHVIDEPGLQIPHPRIAQRAFVLVPLAQLAPSLKHPVSGMTASEMLKALPGTSR